MEEIYDTEVWKNLEKNVLFKEKFEDIVKKCLFYSNKNDVFMRVINNKLIVSYHSRLMNREMNCQYVSNTKYELFIDGDNDLVINELSGSLRSNYGYDFENTNGGVLDTYYSCSLFDKDGIELSFQGYSDSYDINENQFEVYKNGFLPVIENAYNPDLASFANSKGIYLHADILGNAGRFLRQIRFKDELGIVVNESCEFEKNGQVINPKEEYYFNTFLSGQSSLNPEKISITRHYPFATLDKNKVMHFNELYMNLGLTPKNYKEVANARFLDELIDEKNQNGRHIPREISDKYDLMIEKLEKSRTKTL